MKHSEAAVELIKNFEGCKLEAYKDVRGIWTIGFGHAIGVKEGDTITMEQALTYLDNDLSWVDACLEKNVKVALSHNQTDALCSLCFNIGCQALANSTLLKLLNVGDILGASSQFVAWNHAGGKVVEGLTNRRMAERALFLEAL